MRETAKPFFGTTKVAKKLKKIAVKKTAPPVELCHISMFFFKCTESYQIWTLGLMQFYVYPVLIRLFKSVCVRFPHSKSCLWASIVLRDYD